MFNLFFGGEKIADERIKNIFNEYSPIVKAAILRENKVCSREIMELNLKGYVIKIKAGYYC